ncbi:MAG: class I lanthipeptide [Acidobacteria bacterium]|jgi:natural product precursor|nr:class I lanthipeptide [Acidobacteriota bacterium]
MKQKKINRKLEFKKLTISTLNNVEMTKVKGGFTVRIACTTPEGACTTGEEFCTEKCTLPCY